MDRVVCQHAQACAGCPLIHLTYAEQLAAKRQQVREALGLYPLLRYLEVEPVAPAEPFTRYRVRAKLMVGSESDAAGVDHPVLGLFERANGTVERVSHRVIDIPSCQVLAPSLEEIASKVRRLIREPPADAGSCLVPASAGGLLSAFDLRQVIDGESGILVTVVLDARTKPNERELACAAGAVAKLSTMIVGVAVNYRKPGAAQVLGPTTRILAGAIVARDRGSASYRLASYGSFTQAHRGQALRLEEWIASRLTGARSVLDLYGGSGGLSLPLAARGAEVTLVESFAPAAECAARAAAEQRLTKYEVRSGTAGAIIRALVSEGSRFEAVVTNPPRRGMAPSVRKALGALGARVIAYVSCDPDTFSRDVDHLARLGYRTTKVMPVDMIPLTDQIETVAFLEKGATPAPFVVFDDDDLCVVEKFAHEPPACPRTPLREARLVWRVSMGASGLAVWSKTAFAALRLQAALAHPTAMKTHLVLAQGVTSAKGTIHRRTRYRRLARVAGHSLLRVTVHEERGGQIERDLARIGHPVVGDARHGHLPTNRHFEEKYALDRPFLHCIRLTFEHPGSAAAHGAGQTESPRIDVRGTLPGELVMVLGRLGVPILDVVKRVMVG